MSDSQDSLVLALDIGTSSTRALLFDARGQAVGASPSGAVAQREYAQNTTADGGVEIDADYLLELTASCIDQALSSLAQENLRAPIAAVATSCFWHSLLAVGPDDRALSPVFSWADNRAASWLAPLRATLDETATHARTGCVFHPSYWPAKLLWLHHTRPQLFQSDTRWMSFGEYLSLRFFGQSRVSLSMASGTGIFHQVDCNWDAPTLGALPIEETNLSPLCDAADEIGDLRSPYRERWPVLRGAAWYPALGDGACSNIGSGCVDDSAIALNVGTSAALRVVLRDYKEAAPTGLWRYRIDHHRSLLGGALSNAGNIFAWARRNFSLPDELEKSLCELQPDAHGLTILPFLAGERSPLWNAQARLVIEGATLDTTPLEILRGCLEATALRFAAVARLLREAQREQKTTSDADSSTRSGSSDVDIVASGGALHRSPCWSRIACDCIGQPLIESREAEASARGAALLALEACGIVGDIADVPSQRGDVIMPDEASHHLYERALARQNALYEKVYGAAQT